MTDLRAFIHFSQCFNKETCDTFLFLLDCAEELTSDSFVGLLIIPTQFSPRARASLRSVRLLMSLNMAVRQALTPLPSHLPPPHARATPRQSPMKSRTKCSVRSRKVLNSSLGLCDSEILCNSNDAFIMLNARTIPTT
jgi:hypothetical protein